MKQITGIKSCDGCPYLDNLRTDLSGECFHPDKQYFDKEGCVQGMIVDNATIVDPDCPLSDAPEQIKPTDADGWVRVEDHEKIVNELKATIEHLHNAIRFDID